MNRSAQGPSRQALRRQRRHAAAALWEGWRGFIRLSVVCVLAFVLGVLLSHQVEQRWVAPICQAHAAAHGLVYRAVEVHGLRSEQMGPHCLFGTAGSNGSSLWLPKVTGFWPGLWMDFATFTELTVPALAVLLAGLWSGLSAWRRGLQGAHGAPRQD